MGEDVHVGMAVKLRGLAHGLERGMREREESRETPGLSLTWVMVLLSVMGDTGEMKNPSLC